VEWSGLVWGGVVWSGLWSDLVWSGLVWCGMSNQNYKCGGDVCQDRNEFTLLIRLVSWIGFGMWVEFGLVGLGLNGCLIVVWESLWSGAVWGGLVWYGLVWSGLVCGGLVWSDIPIGFLGWFWFNGFLMVVWDGLWSGVVWGGLV
jgi:hypothetical protein